MPSGEHDACRVAKKSVLMSGLFYLWKIYICGNLSKAYNPSPTVKISLKQKRMSAANKKPTQEASVWLKQALLLKTKAYFILNSLWQLPQFSAIAPKAALTSSAVVAVAALSAKSLAA